MANLTKVICALVVAFVAMVIGFRKHWLLRVPRVGIILYAIAGGDMPPYVQPRAFEHYESWFRPGDVLLSTCVKCGTAWNMNILHLMRTHVDSSFTDIYSEVPWIDLVQYPGQTWEKQLDYLENGPFKREYSFRIFKTHFGPPAVPVLEDRKYIVVIRNATDAMASLKPFVRNHDEDLRRMWGGFPPKFETDDEFYHFWNHDSGDGKTRAANPFYIDFVKGWWPYRHKKNVLFIHYADMKRNLDEILAKYREFLKIEMTPEEIEKVKEYSSFEFMKNHQSKYECREPLEPARALGYLPKQAKFLKDDVVVRKGKVGNGAKELRPKEHAEFLKIMDEEIGQNNEIRAWIDFGGSLP